MTTTSTPVSRNVPSMQEYKLLNSCFDNFKQDHTYISIGIANEKSIKIFYLFHEYIFKNAKLENQLKITYICEIKQPIDKRAIYSGDFRGYLLVEKGKQQYKTLIPKALLSNLKVKEYDSFSAITPSNIVLPFEEYLAPSYAFYDGFYDRHPPPKFETSATDFEEMLYYVLNSNGNRIFFGDKIACLIPNKAGFHVLIFRRILLTFIFERMNAFYSFKNAISDEIVKASKLIVLLYPEKHANPVLNFEGLSHGRVKIQREALKQGSQFYAKAKMKNALAVNGTLEYLKAVEYGEQNDLMNILNFPTDYSITYQKSSTVSIMSRISVISVSQTPEKLASVISSSMGVPSKSTKITPQISSASEKPKNIFIEIKDDCFRICGMVKKGKKFVRVFCYPENESYIPMYLSLVRETPVIGYQAVEDYMAHPNCVIFDALKIFGKSYSNPPNQNWEWGFELMATSKSEDAKLGFKIQTSKGFKIFPVELVLAIFFKFLLKIASKHSPQIQNFVVRFFDKKLSTSEKASIKEVSKILNIPILVESHSA